MIPKIAYLNELLHQYLQDDPQQGLQTWSDLFDRYLQVWDIKSCYRLLREIRRMDSNTDAGNLAYLLNKTALGTLAAQTRDWKKAIRVYEELLIITPEENIGWTLSNLANIYYLANDYNKALDNYSKALNEYEKLGDSNGRARVLVNLGSIYRDMGDIQKALESLDAASHLIAKDDPETGIIILVNWAMVLQVSGNLALAEEKYLQALHNLNKFKAPRLLAQALGNIATLYIAKGDPIEAIEYLLRDLAIHQQLGDLVGQGETLNNLGLAYSRMGEIDKALHFYAQSAQIKKDVGDVKGELDSWSNYLVVAIKNNQVIPVEIHQRATTLAKNAGDEHAITWLESIKTGS